jgi:hypothetical protein
MDVIIKLMSDIGQVLYGLVWYLFTTFLLISFLTWVSFKLSKIQKSLGESDVLIFLFLFTFFSLGFEIVGNMVRMPIGLSGILGFVATGIFIYIMSSYYWHIEKAAAKKFLITFMILSALIALYAVINNFLLQNAYNRLNAL